ncbi:energy transducer TonB [Ferruginibacter sp.]
MNNKENDIIYTAKDIAAYLSGKLSPLEMHAMEKAALDDPFLAEAMEGYAGMQEDGWKEQLAALKTGFAKESGQAKVIALPRRKNNWWKVAAAVLLLGGTATLAYLLNTSKKVDQPAIAQQTTTAPATNAVDAEKKADIPPAGNTTPESIASTTTPSANSDKNTVAVKPVTVTENKSTGAVSAEADKTAVAAADKKEDKVAETSKVQETKSDDVVIVGYGTAKRKDVTAATSPATASNANSNAGLIAPAVKPATAWSAPAEQDKFFSEKKADNSLAKKELPAYRSFNAQVLGADNTPLPFANVNIKSENFGTYADVKGNFRLVSADSLLTVEVKAAGYQPQFYTLKSFVQQNKIVLAEEDAASKYKAIAGNNNATVAARSKMSRRATLVKDSMINVEPQDGWDNYNTYVNNNIEIPDDILEKNIHGKVELSFDVSSNGSITNIKVDKSLCDNCDELAKRLIEQGPQWKVKKGKKGKGKVTVQF